MAYICDVLLCFEAVMGVNASLKNDPVSGKDVVHLLENPSKWQNLFVMKDNPDCALA